MSMLEFDLEIPESQELTPRVEQQIFVAVGLPLVQTLPIFAVSPRLELILTPTEPLLRATLLTMTFRLYCVAQLVQAR